MAENTRWFATDMMRPGKTVRSHLYHMWSGGINTFHPHGDGTYELISEGWKPRPDYGINVEGTKWLTPQFIVNWDEGVAHIWDGGVNVLRYNDNGSYYLMTEGWKPRPDYNMNIATTRWLAGMIGFSAEFPPVTALYHLWDGGINTFVSNYNGQYSLVREGWKPRPDYNMNIAGTRWLVGDVNSDGESDLLHLWDGGINTLRSSWNPQNPAFNGMYELVREGWKPRPDYAMNVTTTRWLAGDISADYRSDLVHITDNGIDTFRANGDGTYQLIREGWKPRADYAMDVTGTRWVTGDVAGDGKSDLVHLWNGGINTLRSQGDGTYKLLEEGWKPRPDYGMNVGYDVLND